MNGCPFCHPPKDVAWFETELDWCLCFVPKDSIMPTFAHKAHVPTFTALETEAVYEAAKRMFGEHIELLFDPVLSDHAHATVRETK